MAALFVTCEVFLFGEGVNDRSTLLESCSEKLLLAAKLKASDIKAQFSFTASNKEK